jgi:phosphoserine phosphatase RsbU/P
MKKNAPTARLSIRDMEAILATTRALASPFDLHTMLEAVTDAARNVLRAERASVWLHEPATNDLYIEIASDLRQTRVPIGTGIVGICARDHKPINVPDCYADPRFNPAIDVQSGFHTRCSLTVPLLDHENALIGVMQVLNKANGTFDVADQALAEALAAQCAVALSRVRMLSKLRAADRVRHELELASKVQRRTLPSVTPELEGYAMHGVFMPAAQTGGDTYDLALVEQGLLVVLADATGHGIGPALSVTQMHAMLRMALLMGADLETAFRRVNDRLAQVLAEGNFVTAFIGLLDPSTHRLRFLSGGQAPILHVRGSDGHCTTYRATSFPMGAMPIEALRPAVELDLAPGDWVVLLSDGIFEYENAAGQVFGRERVQELLRAACHQSPAAVGDALLDAVRIHGNDTVQQDDITMVLLRRIAAP